MGILVWISYFIGGLILFFLLNYLKNKYSTGKVQTLIFALIYLLFLSVILSNISNQFNENIFIVFVFEFITNIIYTTYFLGKDFFDKTEDNVSISLLMILSGYILNQQFINKVDLIFLTPEDLRIVIWLLTFVFLYTFFKGKEQETNNIKQKKFMNKEYIVVQYAKLKYQFLEEISLPNKDLNLIIFSIMILNNYKRPLFIRKIDNILFRINGTPRKLGIMQIMSKKFITDTESIEMVYKKLEKLYEKKKTNKVKDVTKDIISSYIKEESEEILFIYEELKKFTSL